MTPKWGRRDDRRDPKDDSAEPSESLDAFRRAVAPEADDDSDAALRKKRFELRARLMI